MSLVTGEAVLLELRVAKLASRSLAFVIDLALQAAVLVAGVFLVGGLATDEALAAGLLLVLTVATLVGYPVTAETLSRGRTLGKLALGLRVVRDDGGPIRFRHALVRALTAVIEIYLLSGVAAFVVSLASERGKRVGDYLAGTLVIRDRVTTETPVVAAMPPELAGWASALQLARLPDDLALAARQFLTRAPALASAIRYDMGHRLSADVAQYVAPGPPLGVPPERYLAAVLAERRRRDLLRLRPPAAGYAAEPGPWPSAPFPPPWAAAAPPPPPWAAAAPPPAPWAAAPPPPAPPTPPPMPGTTAATSDELPREREAAERPPSGPFTAPS